MNIKESDSKYRTENLKVGSDSMKELFNKQIYIYEQWSRFWAASLRTGKKCMDYMQRDIFTPEQRKYYQNVQEKIPIEPQEIKPIIDSLVGQVSQTVRSATITMEDGNPPPHVAKPETVAKVLKFWQNRLKTKRKCEFEKHISEDPGKNLLSRDSILAVPTQVYHPLSQPVTGTESFCQHHLCR